MWPASDEARLTATGRVFANPPLVPQPTNAHFHPYGLADHSLTTAAWRVFLNAIGATASLED